MESVLTVEGVSKVYRMGEVEVRALRGVDLSHLWYSLLGFKGDPHANPIHMLSNVLIFGGFILLSAAWRVLQTAQRAGRLATSGVYAWVVIRSTTHPS